MILCVHSYPGGNGTCARHFPYWQKCGFERIVGIATAGGGCVFPAGMDVQTIGRNVYIAGDELPRRILDTAEWMLAQPGFREGAIIEHDTVVFKQIPSVLDKDGLHAHLAGYWVPGFKAKKYFHNMWLANRGSWELILKHGRQMIYEADYERGFPDYFMAWVCERFNIPTHDKTFYEYSQNTIQGPVALAQAREAYRAGCHVIHGIKNRATLEYIVS